MRLALRIVIYELRRNGLVKPRLFTEHQDDIFLTPLTFDL